MTFAVARILKKIIHSWFEFWFAEQDLLKVSLFRFLIAIYALIQYGIRYLEFDQFYTNRGFLPATEALNAIPEIARPLFQVFPTAELTAHILYVAFLISLFCLVLGVGGRIVTILTYILHVVFIQRNITIVYGADLAFLHWLLYLSLVDHNRYFSVQNYFTRKLKAPDLQIHPIPFRQTDVASRVGVRLLQVQLCIIYAYTGLEKLKGMPWWEGSALWNVLGNQQLMVIDWSFLQSFPLLISVATFLSVLFEVYFPVLVWNQKLRGLVLVAGTFFHLGIALTMGFVFFSFLMFTAYLNFVDDAWLRKQLQRFFGSSPLIVRFITPTPYN